MGHWEFDFSPITNDGKRDGYPIHTVEDWIILHYIHTYGDQLPGYWQFGHPLCGTYGYHRRYCDFTYEKVFGKYRVWIKD